jgi:peptidoglycan/LPS O-acetylase OafA/YrhL
MSDITKKSKYIYSLDALRGVASLSVCLFHTALGNQEFLSKNNYVALLASKGWVGVEIFFIISGFIIPYSMHMAGYNYRFLGQFITKRFVRIEPPYLLSIIFVLILNYISSLAPIYQGKPFVINMSQFLLHLGYLIPFTEYTWYIDVYWTLAIEFQYYIIVVILFTFLFSNRKIISVSALLFFSFLFLLVKNERMMPHYSLLFGIGILSALFFVEHYNKVLFFVLLTILLVCIYIQFDTLILLASILSLLFIFFVKDATKLLKFLGMISYSLYLVHIPVSNRIINLSSRFIEGEIQRTLIVLFAVIISVFVAWLFYVIIEKPAIQWAKKIKYQ